MSEYDNVYNRGDEVSSTKDVMRQVKEDEIARDNFDAYVRARDAGHLEYVELARKFNEYYRGEQWEDSVVSTLNEQGRPHHTINFVLSTVNTILGEQINRRADITFKPSGKGATDEVALALNRVFQNIGENNDIHWVEQEALADGVIEDRGFIDVSISYEDNIFGEVKLQVCDPVDIIPDPNATEADPATWSEVFRSRWMTPDEIETLFGKDKADRVRYRDTNGENSYHSTDSLLFDAPTFGDFRNRAEYEQAGMERYEDEWRRVRRVRVIERQYRKLAPAFFFVDPEEGDERQVPDAWSKEKRDGVALMYGLEIVKRVIRRVRITMSAADVMLYDEWSPYGNMLSIVPYFPYFRRGRPFGVVRNLISPQDLLNKVSSQELHVVNTSANSGWMFKSGTLVNMDAYDLERVGAKTGLVLEYNGDRGPEKIQPNQVPSGLDRISAKAGMYFREISGVQAMMGNSSREVSGVAFEQQQQGEQLQLEVIFDNLAKTRTWMARNILKLVQSHYTETRLLHITDTNDEGNEVQSTMTINEPTPEGEIARDLTVGEYSVVISETKARDNENDSMFAQAMEMRNAGVTIPDHVIIQHSNLQKKEVVAEMVKRMQGMAEPTEEEVRIQQQQQMIQMQMLQAQLQETAAKAMEREANASLLAAKAGNEENAQLLEMQKFGAELRQDLMKLVEETKLAREELATRMAISTQKHQMQGNMALIESMTDRVNSANQRRTQMMTAKMQQETARLGARQAQNSGETKKLAE